MSQAANQDSSVVPTEPAGKPRRSVVINPVYAGAIEPAEMEADAPLARNQVLPQRTAETSSSTKPRAAKALLSWAAAAKQSETSTETPNPLAPLAVSTTVPTSAPPPPKMDFLSLVAAATGKPVPGASAAVGLKGLAQKWRSKAEANVGGQFIELSAQGALGVPVRDLLQALYKRKRDKTIKEGIIYGVWAICFFFIIYGTFNVQLTHETNAALTNRFVDQEFPGRSYRKTFSDVGDTGEFLEWLQGPLFEGLYPPATFSGDPIPSGQAGNVNEVLRIVGSVRIRQVRVRNDSCAEMRHQNLCSVVNSSSEECVPRLDSTDGTCYADYDVDVEAVDPFGPASNPTKYTWSGGLSRLSGLYGWGPEYGRGGYVVDLPGTDRAVAGSLLDSLVTDGFLDRGTRAVAVDFSVYNTATGMITVSRLLYEYFSTSHAQVSYKFYSFYMDAVPTHLSRLITALQFLYLMFVLYWTQKSVKGFWWARPFYAYLKDVATIFDVLLVAMNWVLISQWISFNLGSIFASFSVAVPQFVDIFAVGEAYVDMLGLAGFVGLVGALKMFKYLSLQKRMSIVWLTLGKAGPELFAFTVSFFIVVAGYAFLAHMIFGPYIPDYHSFESCMSSLLRMAVGDFSYDTLASARPALVSVFFGSYVTLVYLISLNIVIAIISKFYDVVHMELRTMDKWKMSVVTVDSYIMQRLVLFTRMRCGCLLRGRQYCLAWCSSARKRCTCTCKKKPTTTFVSPSKSTSFTRSASLSNLLPALKSQATGGPVAYGNPMNVSDVEAGRRRSGQASKLASVLDMSDEEVQHRTEKAARRSRRLQSDLWQLEVWKHENNFMTELGRFYHEAKRKKGFDIYPYLEQLTHSAGWDNCYIGLHELCVLASRQACEPGKHLKCHARRLIDAFQKMKTITMTGGLTGAYRHVPSHSYVNAHGYQLFEVWKLNLNGRKQHRWLVVDVECAQLINFDERMNVRKKLPLVQLTQLERYQDDPCRLGLIFTTTGEHISKLGFSRQIDELLETSYQLLFKDSKERDTFVAEVLKVMEAMPSILTNTVTEAETKEGVGASDAQPVKRGRRSSLATKILDAAKAEYTHRLNITSGPAALMSLSSIVQHQQGELQALQKHTEAIGPPVVEPAMPRSARPSSRGLSMDAVTMQTILHELRTQRKMLEDIMASR